MITLSPPSALSHGLSFSSWQRMVAGYLYPRLSRQNQYTVRLFSINLTQECSFDQSWKIILLLCRQEALPSIWVMRPDSFSVMILVAIIPYMEATMLVDLEKNTKSLSFARHKYSVSGLRYTENLDTSSFPSFPAQHVLASSFCPSSRSACHC